MAKEALVSKLPLPLDQRAGIGVYVGNIFKANRDAQASIATSVRVFQEQDKVYVIGNIENTTDLGALTPVFQAEQKGYDRAGMDGVIFETDDALSDPEESGIVISTEPILKMNIPVQLSKNESTKV